MKSRLTFFFCLVLTTPLLRASPEEELRLEGIVRETASQENSIAVVNGNFLKKGDVYQQHRVLEIGPDFVVVAHEASGEKTRLNLSGKPPAKTVEKKTRERKEEVQESPVPSKINLGGSWNPFAWALNLAWETKGMADLKRIHTACLVYYSEFEEEGEGGPKGFGFKELIERGLLPDIYADGEEGKYRFQIRASREGVEASADPVDPGSKLRSFFLDKDGVLRTERGKPATAKSSADVMP